MNDNQNPIKQLLEQMEVKYKEVESRQIKRLDFLHKLYKNPNNTKEDFERIDDLIILCYENAINEISK